MNAPVLMAGICVLLITGCGDLTESPHGSVAHQSPPDVDFESETEAAYLFDDGTRFANWEEWEGMAATEERLLGLSEAQKQQIQHFALRGKFTDRSLEAISQMPHVKTLAVGENEQITEQGLLHLGKLTQLEEFSYIPPRVHYAEKRTLRLTPAVFKELAALPKLKRLTISLAPLTAECFEELKQSQSLEYLSISVSGVNAQMVKAISEISQLSLLYLTSPDYNGEGIETLATCRSLTGLSLRHTAITDEKVELLTGLDQIISLGLRKTKITDDCVSSLLKMKNLKSIDLAETSLSQNSIDRLINDSHFESIGYTVNRDNKWYKIGNKK